jgi:kinesin family protein C2/C3
VQAINRSLSALGDCVHALATRAPHVPFRASKLTSVLAVRARGVPRTE